MAPSARTRTRWHKAHAPRASAAATSVRESRNTASRRASASRHPPSRVVAAKLETAGYGCFFRFQVVLHLVDRQDAIADHLCKEEARTVAMPGVEWGLAVTYLPRPCTEGAVNGKTVHSDILITGAHKHSSAALPGQARGPGNRTPSISLARTIVRRNGRRMKSVLTGGIKNPQALTGA
jgi:hypothetical protein